MRQPLAFSMSVCVVASLCAVLSKPSTAAGAPFLKDTMFVSRGSQIDMVAPDGAVSVFATDLGKPQEIEFDSQGNLYVACYTDTGSGTVRKIAPDGTVSVLANSRLPPSLSGLALDAAGNVYVSSDGGSGIRKITPTGTVTTYATLPIQTSQQGIDFDSKGNLLVATLGGNLYKIAPPVAEGELGAATLLADTSFSAVGLAVDANDNVFVSNNFSGFFRFDAAGVSTGFWSGTDRSKHLALNSAQHVLVADSDLSNGNLKKYNLTDSINTVAGNLTGITGVAVWVPEPSGIAVIGLGVMATTVRRRR